MRNNPKVGIYADFSWAFILDEVEESTTRLIVRMRANAGPRMFRLLTLPLCFLISSLIHKIPLASRIL